MKQTRSLMGMHITVDVVDRSVKKTDIDAIFAYFTYVDKKFSTYKQNSEISQINDGKIFENNYSMDMKLVLFLSEQTKKETNGYFDVYHNGKIDPSGLVKGWAIWQASQLLAKKGFSDYYVNAGGDVQVHGKNEEGKLWTVGIQNPFNTNEIVKVISLENKGIATSGTYVRGQHIYNPHAKNQEIVDIVSLTVIGPNVFEADRFATAAFAMGKQGIYFIEKITGLEGYMIDKNGIGTWTSNFSNYIKSEESLYATQST